MGEGSGGGRGNDGLGRKQNGSRKGLVQRKNLLLAMMVKLYCKWMLQNKVQCGSVVWVLRCFVDGENYVIIDYKS